MCVHVPMLMLKNGVSQSMSPMPCSYLCAHALTMHVYAIQLKILYNVLLKLKNIN